MAGNLNTYALTQFKRQIGVTGSTDDATYLPFLEQGVYEADRTLEIGMSVTVSGSDYTVAPDPGVKTAILWNVISWAAMVLYREHQLNEELEKMGGVSSIRDEVTSFNRAPVLQIMERRIERAKRDYSVALAKYGISDPASACADELGVRESDP